VQSPTSLNRLDLGPFSAGLAPINLAKGGGLAWEIALFVGDPRR
jgi:hypothetical protein